MAINKVVMNTENGAETLIDLTNDTVTPETLAEGVTAHDASGEEITGTMPTTTVPDYWLSELETKADTIQQAMETAGRNKSAFLWYTDAHWPLSAKMSPSLLKYLVKNTPMNKVNFGGDIIGDPSPHNHENTLYVYDWRKRIADLPNHHSVYGNHDVNHWTTDVSKMAYAHLIAPEESAEMVVGDDSCYYIDNPSEKTRYLYLSYLTSDHTAMMAQGQFIIDAIKGVEEGWHIVVIAHRWWQYSSSSTPTVGSVPTYEAEILSILDAYNARTTREGSNYFYAQDFTTGCSGKVEFCIGGHIHIDHDFTSDGGIPVIITAADTNQERASGETEDCGTVGTTTESAVFGIIADYNDADSTKITVVGVGRGTSRIVRQSAATPTSISDIAYSGDTTVGAALDASKFSFTVSYSNGTTDTVNGATSVSPETIGAVGNNTVTVTYVEGGTTLSGTVTIVGTAVPVANLLNLDREYVSGTDGEYLTSNLDESKAYLNAYYGDRTFNASSCTASNVTEDSVTVKESGIGGVCVAYPVNVADIGADSVRVTFDYSGAGKCRSYYCLCNASGVVATGTKALHVDDTAGASGSADVTIDLQGCVWIVIFLSSNTGNTKTFTNVSLTKA